MNQVAKARRTKEEAARAQKQEKETKEKTKSPLHVGFRFEVRRPHGSRGQSYTFATRRIQASAIMLQSKRCTTLHTCTGCDKAIAHLALTVCVSQAAHTEQLPHPVLFRKDPRRTRRGLQCWCVRGLKKNDAHR